jgi:hypothetical protein
MLFRVEILKGQTKRVICTHHWTGRDLLEIEEQAERERRLHQGDGFRLRNLHTNEVKEVRP